MTRQQAAVHCLRLMLAGHSEAEVRALLKKEAPRLKADAVLGEVATHLANVAAQPDDVRRGYCLEAARELYRRMVEVGDFAGALRALQELGKLAQLHQKTAAAAPAQGNETVRRAELIRLVRRAGSRG